MTSLHCIKCRSVYQSDDPEPYYCPKCDDERKAIAAEIDKKFAGRSTEPVMSELQQFDASAKFKGFVITRL